MDQINLLWIRTRTQKFLKINLKNKRHNRVWRLLQPDQRRKQNHKEETPADHSQRIIPMTARNWIDIEPGEHSLRTKFRRKWFIFFVIHRKYIEKKMQRFIYGESSFIFRVNFLIGLTIEGKHAWQHEEVQKEDISTALMIQEQMCISAFFKDIQDAILLILLYRTVVIQSGFFQHIYHIWCAFKSSFYHQR